MKSATAFGKHERLHGDIRIAEVFGKGKSFSVHPFRVVYLSIPGSDQAEIQVMFSVPKRNIRLAVRRNRMKRLMRESYRKQKSMLNNHLIPLKTSLYFCVLYTGSTLINYTQTEDKIIQIVNRLCSIHEETAC